MNTKESGATSEKNRLAICKVFANFIDVRKENGAFLVGKGSQPIPWETPAGDAVDASCLELIIVPAVALDGKRNRLGRGKGFYDRLLSTTDCPTIGVVCDFQLVEEVPVESHDRPLDCVVTSDTVIANPEKQSLFA